MTHETHTPRHSGHPLFGVDVLHDPRLNKGTAFSEEERDHLRLRGLLPPRIFSTDEQIVRCLEGFHHSSTDLSKYVYLASLQERNETLFYRVLMENLGLMMPIVYTPTVGAACQTFGNIFRRPRGLYISTADRGRIADVLKNWPESDVGVIVVTDGERILGLGDQGAHGMGIPVGKLQLYTACAGVDPRECLPITIDVGTNNEALLRDPLYLGLIQHRVGRREYDELIEEFMLAVHETFPAAIIQFEDFANHNAFRLLKKYRDRVRCFNDDIQGTAAVTYSGLLSALRLTGGSLEGRNLLFFGAGEAGIGTGDLIVAALMRQGVPEKVARRQCWFFDSNGLIVADRKQLAEHKTRFAHEHPGTSDLLEAIHDLRPIALLGFSGQAQTFTQPVIELMADIQERPIIFALSNPTSKAECTAWQAYEWSKGTAVFASGSPFDPVEYAGQTYVPGQGNNAYIFPGVGMGVLVSGARFVTDEMFAVAATVLAEQVSDEERARHRIFPELTRVREVSSHIAASVAEVAHASGVAAKPRPDDIMSHVRSRMYEPVYRDYL